MARSPLWSPAADDGQKISAWMPRGGDAYWPRMKSSCGMMLVLLVFVLVVTSGALIWYLSKTAEFSRKDTPPAAQTR